MYLCTKIKKKGGHYYIISEQQRYRFTLLHTDNHIRFNFSFWFPIPLTVSAVKNVLKMT